MKSILRIGLGLLAAGICVGSGQSFAAPIIKGSTYEDNAVIFCSNDTNCLMSFSPIPAGKTVLITHVACRVETGNAEAQFAMLTLKGGFTRAEYLALFPTAHEGPNHHYAASGQTQFYYAAQQTPQVFVQLFQFSGIVVGCRITGRTPSPF